MVGYDRPARDVVVERDRPKLPHWRIGLDVQPVGLAAVEIIAVFVLRRFEIDLSKVQGAALHGDGIADRLVKPRAALIDLRGVVGILIELNCLTGGFGGTCRR